MKEITEHVLRQIEKTEVQLTTMHYMSVKNVFPSDFYNQILEMPNDKADNAVFKIFDDPRIVKLLYKKFGSQKLRSDTIKSIYTFWQQSGCGYSLKPHVDSYPRVFTIIVNLAENDDAPQCGTAIYTVDVENKTYETNAVIPYLKNSIGIIAPHDHTWHGVNLIEEKINRRSVVVVFSAQEWNEEQMHYADWKPGATVNYEK